MPFPSNLKASGDSSSQPFFFGYKAVFHLLLISFFISICYSGTLNHSFHLDDTPNIVKNENLHLTELTWQGVKKASYFHGGTASSEKLSRPVSRLSLALNYYIGGLNVFGYHVVNIAIHILTASFLYFLFWDVLRLYASRSSHTLSGSEPLQDIALFAVVLWAIHPIQTQAVTYIVQRMASLSAMFYILAFYLYVRGRCSKEVVRMLLLFGLSGCCWLLGIFSKENAVVLPVVIIIFEIFFFPANRKKVKIFFYILGLVSLVSVGVFFLLRGSIVEYFSQSYAYRPFTMWERLLTEPRILWQYIFLLFTPLQDFLTIESDIRPSTGLFAPWTTFPSIVGVLSLVVGAFFIRKRAPLVSFAILFYFINHVVESSFIALELYFEHRNYLPSVFIYLVIAWFLALAWRYYRLHKKIFMQWLVIVASVFIMTSEALATWLRNDVWRDDISLFTDAAQKSPENLRLHGTLAVAHLREKDYEAAKEELKIGEKLYKKYPKRYQYNNIALIYYNAGVRHTALGNHEKAQKLFFRALQFDQSVYAFFANFAVSSFTNNDLVSAEKGMLNALNLAKDKDKSLLYNMLGRIYYQQGEVEKALQAFRDGLDHDDSLDVLRINIMCCYLHLGDRSAAKSALRFTKSVSDDIFLLLIRAILQEDDNDVNQFTEIADLLFRRGVDYCKWLQDVKKNDLPGIIWPDISSIEDKLLSAYNKRLVMQTEEILEMKRLASNCQLP